MNKLSRHLLTAATCALGAGDAAGSEYFRYDAENGTVGQNIPELGSGVDFAFTTTAGSTKGTVRASPLVARQGSKYFGFDIATYQHDAQADVRNHATMPFNLVMGTTYYLAVFFNYTEVNGHEVFYTDPAQIGGRECASKGIEIHGDGLRWIVGEGMRDWDGLVADLSPHRWSHWLGNPSHHLNPTRESYDAFLPNQNGYNSMNWPTVSSGTWHSVVLAVKMARDETGSAAFWLDGVKISEYLNIKTVADIPTPTLDQITMNGTLCQNYYDVAGTPAHVKNYDALLLTDEWQAVVSGGYLSPNAGTMDAGILDAGAMDAGAVDAGVVDAGVVDAGAAEGGAHDAGTSATAGVSGCGCSGAPGTLFALAALSLRRRATRPESRTASGHQSPAP